MLSFDELTGDQLFVDRFSYHFVKPNVGSGLVFRTGNIQALAAEYGDQYFVKRLVGGPGDVLEVKGTGLVRNGEPATGAEYLRRECPPAREISRLRRHGTACTRLNRESSAGQLLCDGRQLAEQSGRALLGLCSCEGRGRKAALRVFPVHLALGTCPVAHFGAIGTERTIYIMLTA
jgi:hypothetical protein